MIHNLFIFIDSQKKFEMSLSEKFDVLTKKRKKLKAEARKAAQGKFQCDICSAIFEKERKCRFNSNRSFSCSRFMQQSNLDSLHDGHSFSIKKKMKIGSLVQCILLLPFFHSSAPATVLLIKKFISSSSWSD